MFQGSLRRVDADPATPACAWRRERSPNLNRGLEYSVSGLVARESFGSLSVPTGRKVFISWDSTRPEHRFSNLDPGSDLQHRRIAERPYPISTARALASMGGSNLGAAEGDPSPQCIAARF